MTHQVRLGAIAHGGSCVARIDGRVIFVRHGLPGELVEVSITDSTKDRFWWGDVAKVIEASPDRVDPPCPVAFACGGCDFQHADLAVQRELKAQVIAEQLHRLAGINWPVEVEYVPGDDPAGSGLGWRTRMRYLVENGRVGLREWRSNNLVELPEGGCRIAHPKAKAGLEKFAIGAKELQVCVADSSVSVLDEKNSALSGPKVVSQTVLGRDYKVRADGFWQVHPLAAEVLSQTVMKFLSPRKGEHALDLYCGVGLFAGALTDAGCIVSGIEIAKPAIRMARQNVPEAKFHAGDMARSLNALPRRTDLIVLDPPRSGAGAKVVKRLAMLGARAICYVACDPAALARDLKTFFQNGYELRQLRAFDLFPMTHPCGSPSIDVGNANEARSIAVLMQF